MPGDDNDKLLTEKQAILNARIAPDNDKMIREIDHKVVINGKPYFLAHAYTVGRDFTFTHGWYIVDRETGDLYKAYAAADLYYYVEKDFFISDTAKKINLDNDRKFLYNKIRSGIRKIRL